MFPEDLKKLFTGRTLFSLDRFISPLLLPALYLAGLASIALWAVSHLVLSFSQGLAAGIWGLLEILAFGTLAFAILRVSLEYLAVFFRANAAHTQAAPNPTEPEANLIADVQSAISQLAQDEPEAPTESEGKPAPAPKSRKSSASKPAQSAKKTTTRRTAKRSTARKPSDNTK